MPLIALIVPILLSPFQNHVHTTSTPQTTSPHAGHPTHCTSRLYLYKIHYHSTSSLARVNALFLCSVWHALNRYLSISTCTRMYAAQVFYDISLHIWKCTIHTACTCARVCTVCLLALGDESVVIQLVYAGVGPYYLQEERWRFCLYFPCFSS